MANRNCPTDFGEQAERYLLGQLLPQETAALEEHYLACPRCTAVLEQVETYVNAMRSAGRRARKKAPTVATARK